MTTYLNESFFYLLLAFNASVICLFLLGKTRRLQGEIATLRSAIYVDREQSAINLTGFHARLQSVEGLMDLAKASKAELQLNKSMDTSLNQANKLLDLGIGADQLVKGFGLSEAEANLMSLLHTEQERVSKAA